MNQSAEAKTIMKGWWAGLPDQLRATWGPLVKAMTEEEKVEFAVLWQRERGKLYSPAGSPMGRNEEWEAEDRLYAYWVQRLGARLTHTVSMRTAPITRERVVGIPREARP